MEESTENKLTLLYAFNTCPLQIPAQKNILNCELIVLMLFDERQHENTDNPLVQFTWQQPSLLCLGGILCHCVSGETPGLTNSRKFGDDYVPQLLQTLPE